jgi:tetratricopeptide (TPR) repeat protein
MLFTIAVVVNVPAQDHATHSESPNPPEGSVVVSNLSARRAVREGNRFLIAGKPDVALQAYNHAETLRPDAPEITFVQGLAHFDLGEFDEARAAFREVSASGNEGLADDALYSLGTCDHAEAVDSIERDPQRTLSLLESAMRRYRDVLANRPDHKPARDANRKAALTWRTLKHRLQEQQQKSEGQPDRTEEQKDTHPEKDQRENEREQQPLDPDSTRQPDQQLQEPTPVQKELQCQEQKASREQAERRLRELIQAQRQRSRMRRQQVQKIPVSPVDKDW